MHGLLNLIIALIAGGVSLAILRSVWKIEDGWRILVAVLIGIVVFFANLAQYILTNNQL